MSNEVNAGRQKNIDYAKALAIVFMILIHVLMYPASSILSEPLGYFTSVILGGYLSAPVFMVSMGVGMAYSKKQDPDEVLKRGIHLLILAYAVNIARSAVPVIINIIRRPPDLAELLIHDLLFGDILTFAGLAFIFMGLLEKLKLSDLSILIVGFVLNILVSVLPLIRSDSILVCVTAGLFIPIPFKNNWAACFPLFTWFIYAAAGNYFGRQLRMAKDTDRFYKITGTGGAILLLVMIFTKSRLKQAGIYTGFKAGEYFSHIVYTLTALGIVFTEYSLLHFLTKKGSNSADSFVLKMSDSLNEIYIISWIIILNINNVVFGRIFPNNYRLRIYAILFVFTLTVSVYLGMKWKDHKKKA